MNGCERISQILAGGSTSFVRASQETPEPTCKPGEQQERESDAHHTVVIT